MFFIIKWIDECFNFYSTQEICRKIHNSAVPHPDDKSLIQQIAAGLNCGKCCGPLCCLDKLPNVSISPSDPHWPNLGDLWNDRASADNYLVINLYGF